MKLSDTCTACRLSQRRRNIVWGDGPYPAPVMLVAEGPGKYEDIYGKPFYHHAKAGEELTHILNYMIHLPRENVYITNSVKCRPPNNNNPKSDDVNICTSLWLEEEIKKVQPQVIGTIGRISTRYFLGDVSMERVHGIPFQDPRGFVIVPIYHPASGLRSPKNMMRVHSDFRVLSDVLRHKREPQHLQDKYPCPNYEVLNNPRYIGLYLQDAKIVAIDTEWAEEKPWCMSLSVRPGEAIVIMANNVEGLNIISQRVKKSSVLCLIHNALYDLPVLSKMDIFPAKVADTMVMAYLLQTEPQGLKDLAFRHESMVMSDYRSMIQSATISKTLDYLTKVVNKFSGVKADPVLVWEKGIPRAKQPQPIAKKAETIIHDTFAKDADPRKRWFNIPAEERKAVEEKLGVVEEGFLSDIKKEDATYYAARDADATIRIYPRLWQQIQNAGLEDTFWRDMDALPMVVDMMQTGIQIDPDSFRNLSKYFKSKMEELQSYILALAGKDFDVGSPQQVGEVLFDDLKLKKIKGKSTDDKKVLSILADKHPIVPLIRDWRGYQKLKSTYSDPMPSRVGPDGRIHATFRITRTDTGRLCIDPRTLIEMPRDMEKYPDGVPLKQVKKGDWIYSFDYKRELCLKKVKWVGPTKISKTVKIKYNDRGSNKNFELILSPDHLVRLFNGLWKPAAFLKPGDRLLCMVNRHNHGQGYYSSRSEKRNHSLYSHSRDLYSHSRNGKNHVVLSVEKGPVLQLWDLEIEDTHCFIGNEVALHNSASKPNVMAQPVRSEEAIKIRKGFIAKPGCKLASGDYSQLEMRILAHMSQDPTLIRIFKNGEDVHAITASEMWGIPVEDLHPKKHRYPAKRINYLIAYGGGAYGLFNQFKQDGVTGYTLQSCQEMINRWYEIYGAVRDNYIKPTISFCRQHGYVKTMFGRIRYLPSIRSQNKWQRAEAERMAINTPIQGTASDIMKEAMRLLVPIYTELADYGYIKPLLQVHDDLIWEIEKDLVDLAIPMIQIVMEYAVQLLVPTPIDPKIGDRWGEMEDWIVPTFGR